ncbi:SRPBCC family protein [Microbacterium sp. ZW T6_19]|uniref:SRPBCC family protein n=1 Tax=Microbacterium sp. ZW T6_19 TaxID=3378082 RepID=UPI0038530A43
MTSCAVHASHAVPAPAEDVWAVLTDLESAKSTLPGVVDIERLEGTAYDVGTRWREPCIIFGKLASEVMEVTAVDPLHATTVRAVNRGVIYATEFRLVTADELTVVTMLLTGRCRTRHCVLVSSMRSPPCWRQA